MTKLAARLGVTRQTAYTWVYQLGLDRLVGITPHPTIEEPTVPTTKPQAARTLPPPAAGSPNRQLAVREGLSFPLRFASTRPCGAGRESARSTRTARPRPSWGPRSSPTWQAPRVEPGRERPGPRLGRGDQGGSPGDARQRHGQRDRARHVGNRPPEAAPAGRRRPRRTPAVPVPRTVRSVRVSLELFACLRNAKFDLQHKLRREMDEGDVLAAFAEDAFEAWLEQRLARP